MLLLIVSFAPSQARAGCGHDVTSRESRLIHDALDDLELLRHSDSRPSDRLPAGPREKPCAGPSCLRTGIAAGTGAVAFAKN